ncbi:hypothetical protein GN244_ATG03321 [Phytophthora infestans]|uniref:Uncharacterized protein n=1 Tax=Phytophthora infestans TaxID=4787 RepID=A0A833TJ71_PHYIN|nr:hypothetical protein GN244_ATG03321 [Phytophthora infestans]
MAAAVAFLWQQIRPVQDQGQLVPSSPRHEVTRTRSHSSSKPGGRTSAVSQFATDLPARCSVRGLAALNHGQTIPVLSVPSS